MRSSHGTGARGADDPSDAELVVAFRDGDDGAYGELVRRYQIPLFRLLLGLLAAGDEAEVLCEDVFVKAARDIEDLSVPERFYAWLVGRGRAVVTPELTASVVPPPPQSVEPQDHLAHSVRVALADLEPTERAVLIFSELQQNVPEDIADAVGMDVQEVKVLIRRARARFVDKLTRGRAHTTADEHDAPDEEPEPLEAGETLAGRYRIESVLGSGGMGIVYRAHHSVLDRPVAIKMLHGNVARVERVRERFRREALVLGRAQHPSFVEVIDLGETDDGLLYLVMEFLEGESLRSVLDSGPLELERALAIASRIAEGLGHLHGEGIVHRDLKPDNIVLVEQEGTSDFPKILDFGIARYVTVAASQSGRGARMTRGRAILGTPAYIAPEQAVGSDVDERADIYALGVTLYELLTGELPFDDEDPGTLLMMHVSKAPPPIAAHAHGWTPDPALEALVARCLAKDPEDRMPDAATLQAELGRMASASSVERG